MNAAIPALVGAAIGLALSPLSLVKMILVLFSQRRAVNAIAFVGVLLLGTIAGLAIGAAGATAAGDEPGSTSKVVAIVMLVLGGILLALGQSNWRNRRDESAPKVLQAIEGMGPLPVAALAVTVTLTNPKNLVILLAAGEVIGMSWSGGGALAAGLVFLLVATLPFTAITAYALLGGAGAEARLDHLRTWLIRRNRLIIGIIGLVLGLLLVVKALAALVG
jgi:hypothetical protein